MPAVLIWYFKYCARVTALCLLYAATASSLIAQTNINPSSGPHISSKQCEVNIPAPEIAPANMTPLTYNLSFICSMSNRGGDKLIGGAFYYAIEVLEQIARDKSIPVTFTKTVHDTRNTESSAIKTMADLYCHGNVSAFIGPEAHCRSAGLMAAAFNTPYMTYGCMDNHNQTNRPIMINTNPSIAYVSKFILAVLQRYDWSSFWLVTGISLDWKYTGEQLINIAEATNYTLNGLSSLQAAGEFNPNHLDNNPFANLIQSSREDTRVYVFLGCYECLIVFLRGLWQSGVTQTGKYVVVAANNNDRPAKGVQFYMTTHEWFNRENITTKQMEEKLQAFRNAMLVEVKVQKGDRKTFEKAVFERSTSAPFNYPKPPPFISSIPNMGRRVYRLYDATMLIGLSVMSLMGTVGADPTDAYQVTQHIKGRRHCSKQGYDIMIHKNGETEDDYEVRGHVFNQDGSNKGSFNVIGTFLRDERGLVYSDTVSFWRNGDVPVSQPECGFNGEYCLDESSFPIYAIVLIPVGVVACVLCIVSCVLRFRQYKDKKKLERLLWKIDLKDIKFPTDDEPHHMATPRPKKKDSFGNMSAFLLHDSPDIGDTKVSETKTIGEYKGCDVFIKKMNRKNLDLSKSLKQDFQTRKEMTHDNINRFIGACIDDPYVTIVTQYCNRKSLKDILDDQSLPPQEMFVTSLVQDLINGMIFIHGSDLKYHGNLKSSNCLVDKRWTLKITDFGFSSIGDAPRTRGDDDRTYANMLWTAPELLQSRCTSSSSFSSQNNSSSVNYSFRPSRTISFSHQHCNRSANSSKTYRSQQRGDVYSFAIILYELHGQAGPFGHSGLSAWQIIEKLLSPSEVFRPNTDSLTCDKSIINLMHSCWASVPEDRPEFKYVIVKFKWKQQGSLMEQYADNLENAVAEKTHQLWEEKKLTENLLHRMLPRPVAEKLMKNQVVQPEQFECVTIYFSDIVGFTQLSAESTPMEVVTLLNDLYSLFDSVIHKFGVYKVETIGDAYMVVSGLPNPNGDLHAGEIASMSLWFLQKLKEKRFTVRGTTDYTLKIRIGIHSGPCCAGVVGLMMPRYCLFGDTVNTANRMESTGEEQKIHCSAECKSILDKLGGYHMEERGHTEVKGKGQLLTYFLISEDKRVRQQRLNSITSTGRCVSSSNLDYSGTPLNRRSAPPIPGYHPLNSPKQNGIRSSSFSLPHNTPLLQPPFHTNTTKTNCVAPASLNTSIDSTASISFYPNDSFDSETHSLADFRSSTLPRPTVMRQNSISGCVGGKSMSPIAEDPWSPSSQLSGSGTGFKFHDNSLAVSSDTESECETLLTPLPPPWMKRHHSLHRQNSLEHPPGVRQLMRNSSMPSETVL